MISAKGNKIESDFKTKTSEVIKKNPHRIILHHSMPIDCARILQSNQWKMKFYGFIKGAFTYYVTEKIEISCFFSNDENFEKVFILFYFCNM